MMGGSTLPTALPVDPSAAGTLPQNGTAPLPQNGADPNLPPVAAPAPPPVDPTQMEQSLHRDFASDNPFEAGVIGGVKGLGADYHALVGKAQAALGYTDAATDSLHKAQAAQQNADSYTANGTGSFTDAQKSGKWGQYIAHTIGGALPAVAGTVGAALATEGGSLLAEGGLAAAGEGAVEGLAGKVAAKTIASDGIETAAARAGIDAATATPESIASKLAEKYSGKQLFNQLNPNGTLISKIGEAAGATVGGTVTSAGGNVNDVLTDPGDGSTMQDRAQKALLSDGAQGLLQAVPSIALLHRYGLGAAAEEAVSKAPWFSRVAQEATKQGGIAGGIGAAASVTNKAMHNWITGSNDSLVSTDALTEYLNSAASGAVGGIALGGPAGFFHGSAPENVAAAETVNQGTKSIWNKIITKGRKAAGPVEVDENGAPVNPPAPPEAPAGAAPEAPAGTPPAAPGVVPTPVPDANGSIGGQEIPMNYDTNPTKTQFDQSLDATQSTPEKFHQRLLDGVSPYETNDAGSGVTIGSTSTTPGSKLFDAARVKELADDPQTAALGIDPTNRMQLTALSLLPKGTDAAPLIEGVKAYAQALHVGFDKLSDTQQASLGPYLEAVPNGTDRAGAPLRLLQTTNAMGEGEIPRLQMAPKADSTMVKQSGDVAPSDGTPPESYIQPSDWNSSRANPNAGKLDPDAQVGVSMPSKLPNDDPSGALGSHYADVVADLKRPGPNSAETDAIPQQLHDIVMGDAPDPTGQRGTMAKVVQSAMETAMGGDKPAPVDPNLVASVSRTSPEAGQQMRAYNSEVNHANGTGDTRIAKHSMVQLAAAISKHPESDGALGTTERGRVRNAVIIASHEAEARGRPMADSAIREGLKVFPDAAPLNKSDVAYIKDQLSKRGGEKSTMDPLPSRRAAKDIAAQQEAGKKFSAGKTGFADPDAIEQNAGGDFAASEGAQFKQGPDKFAPRGQGEQQVTGQLSARDLNVPKAYGKAMGEIAKTHAEARNTAAETLRKSNDSVRKIHADAQGKIDTAFADGRMSPAEHGQRTADGAAWRDSQLRRNNADSQRAYTQARGARTSAEDTLSRKTLTGGDSSDIREVGAKPSPRGQPADVARIYRAASDIGVIPDRENPNSKLNRYTEGRPEKTDESMASMYASAKAKISEGKLQADTITGRADKAGVELSASAKAKLAEITKTDSRARDLLGSVRAFADGNEALTAKLDAHDEAFPMQKPGGPFAERIAERTKTAAIPEPSPEAADGVSVDRTTERKDLGAQSRGTKTTTANSFGETRKAQDANDAHMSSFAKMETDPYKDMSYPDAIKDAEQRAKDGAASAKKTEAAIKALPDDSPHMDKLDELASDARSTRDFYTDKADQLREESKTTQQDTTPRTEFDLPKGRSSASDIQKSLKAIKENPAYKAVKDAIGRLRSGKDDETKYQGVVDALTKKFGIPDVKFQFHDDAASSHAGYIETPTEGMATLSVNGKLRPHEKMAVLSHELGHHLQTNLWDKLSEESKQPIYDAYQHWLDNLREEDKTALGVRSTRASFFRTRGMVDRLRAGMDPKFTSLSKDGQNYLLHFNEFFADSTARAMDANADVQKTVSGFFPKIAHAMSLIQDLFTGKDRSLVDAPDAFKDFVKSAWQGGFGKELDEAAAQGRNAADSVGGVGDTPKDGPAPPGHDPIDGIGSGTGAQPTDLSHLLSPLDRLRAFHLFSRLSIVNKILSNAKEEMTPEAYREFENNALNVETQMHTVVNAGYKYWEAGKLDFTGGNYADMLHRWSEGIHEALGLKTSDRIGKQILSDAKEGIVAQRAAGYKAQLALDMANGVNRSGASRVTDYSARTEAENKIQAGISKKISEAKVKGDEAQQKVLTASLDARKKIIGLKNFFDDKIEPIRTRALVNLDERMRDTGLPAAMQMAALVNRRTGELSANDEAMSSAQQRQSHILASKYGKIVEKLTPDQEGELVRAMQTRTDVSDPALLKTQNELRAHLADIHDYLSKSGAEVGHIKDYWPVVTDKDYVAAHKDEFHAILNATDENGKLKIKDDDMREYYVKQFLRKGEDIKTAKNSAAALSREDMTNGFFNMASYTPEVTGQGTTYGESGMATAPGGREFHPRVSEFLYKAGHQDLIDRFAKFQSGSLHGVMLPYMNRVVKKAEFTSRFIYDKPVPNSTKTVKGSRINDLFEQARNEGASEAQLKTMTDYIDSAVGVMGSGKNGFLQKAFGAVDNIIGSNLKETGDQKWRDYQKPLMAYQNLRTMALGSLGSLIDPLGSWTRSSSLKDSFGGLREAMGKGSLSAGFLQNMGEMLGTVKRKGLSDLVATTYGDGTDFKSASAKVNDALFRMNGQEGLANFSRNAALATGMRFLLRHGAGADEHSARYLKELGLTAADVKADPSEIGAVQRSPQIDRALYKFVEESVVLPRPTQRTGWMNDPHFQFAAQYKNFMYAFYDTVALRMFHEIKHGNVGVVAPAAGYLATTMAAEMAREFIQYGPNGNPGHKDWGIGDHLEQAAVRSGLADPEDQMDYSAAKNTSGGSIPYEDIAGTSVEQLHGFVKATIGDGNMGSAIEGALPFSSVYRGWF